MSPKNDLELSLFVPRNEAHSMHLNRWQTPYAMELLALMDSHLSALRLLEAYRSREGVPALLQSIAAASASATLQRSEQAFL